MLAAVRRPPLALLLVAAAAASAAAFAPPPRAPLPSDPAVLRAARADAARPAAKPRLLTNGLEAAQARRLARNEALGGGGGGSPYSYSGYLGVDAQCGSEMFYWYFPAQNGNASAPVALWLQGGPGGSSMFGLFGENGPYSVSDRLTLEKRNVTWARDMHMLYIDNPVGVGFSVTDTARPGCLSTNQTMVAENLYTALLEFFRVHDEVAANPFYVTGESYGGKYVPALGKRILDGNARGTNARINLAGVAIGDGLTDPVTQVNGYSGLAYSFGIADLRQMEVFERNQTLAVQQIKAGEWAACSKTFTNIVDGPPDYFSTISGSHNYYDLRTVFSRSYGGPWATFLNQSSVRDQLHVGDNYFSEDGSAAGDALNDDICKSELPALVQLLDAPGVRVLLYNGQFDFIVAPVTTELMLQSTDWKGLAAYQAAPRGIWRLEPDDEDVAGYVRHTDSLTQIILRGAGHISPGDQPERCYDMMRRFTQGLAFY